MSTSCIMQAKSEYPAPTRRRYPDSPHPRLSCPVLRKLARAVGIEPTPRVLEAPWTPCPSAYGVIDGSRTHAVLLHREAFYRRNPITIMVGRQRIELCCSEENAFTARPGNHPCRTTRLRPEGRVSSSTIRLSKYLVEPTGIEPATVCLQGSPVTLNLDPKNQTWRKKEVSIPSQLSPTTPLSKRVRHQVGSSSSGGERRYRSPGAFTLEPPSKRSRSLTGSLSVAEGGGFEPLPDGTIPVFKAGRSPTAAPSVFSTFRSPPLLPCPAASTYRDAAPSFVSRP